MPALQIIQDHRLGGHEFGTCLGHRSSDFMGNRRDAVAVAVQQVAGMDHDAADVDRDIQLHDLAVAVAQMVPLVKHGKFSASTWSRSRPAPLVIRPTAPNAL